MASGVNELLDMLFESVEEAKNVPLSGDKCMLDRAETLDLIDEIRGAFPMELAEAKKLRSARDEYIASAKREGERCLSCNVVCQTCADVCPNRANVVVALPGGRHQILHVDRMCNECGNCAIFCPYDSAPYRDKFTLFKTREGFDESVNNQGFLPLGGGKVLVRLDGKVFEADLPADIEVFILTVLNKYTYLL